MGTKLQFTSHSLNKVAQSRDQVIRAALHFGDGILFDAKFFGKLLLGKMQRIAQRVYGHLSQHLLCSRLVGGATFW